MNINNILLNSSNENSNIPPAAVIKKTIKKVIEPQKQIINPQILNEPLTPKPNLSNIKIQNETLDIESIYIFSLLSKILLPKNEIKKISILIYKLLNLKSSSQIVSKTITEITQNYPP